MKKAAIKGMVILAVVVLLCVFFSGTLHSLLTAKVKLVSPKSGRLETVFQVSGQLSFPEGKAVFVRDFAGEDSIMIRDLKVSIGSYVEEGEEILRYGWANAESQLQTLSDQYDTKEKETLELLRKHTGLALTPPQQEWLELYQLMKAARNQVKILRVDFYASCIQEGITPEGDALTGSAASNALKKKEQALAEANLAAEAAQTAFERKNVAGLTEDLQSELIQQADLEAEMEELTRQMAEWEARREEEQVWYAEHAGYVTQLDIKEGDTLSADSLILKLTETDEQPCIRLDISKLNRSLEAGTTVKLEAGERSVNGVSGAEGITAEGVHYVEVALNAKDIAALGGTAALQEENAVSASFRSKSEASTTLIPTAALRGSEGAYYVYTVQTSINGLGAETMTITRKEVKLLGQNDSTSSIDEKLTGEQLVYMEDRSLSEGCEVQLYAKEGST